MVRLFIGRRATLSALAPLLSVLPWAPPAGHAETAAEAIRRAASALPGYGPPDLIYPQVFAGRWAVQRKLVKVELPLGEAAAPVAEIVQARALEARAPIEFEARFLRVVDEDGCIADRAFNAERRVAAIRAAPVGNYVAKWEPSNPNVLTLSSGEAGGRVVETKVTKRSFESPGDGAFGTSEYARVADAGSAGVIDAVPLIRAVRVQARYRWEPVAAGPVNLIEGIEIEQIFDPTATGFADLAGATPVLTTKARLTMTRLS
eukprot:scaffold130176_cov30-Tisochrysis_lutea.AAC.1